MLNWIFFGLVAIAAVCASHLGLMREVTAASVSSAKTAVDIAIGLIGQMALWLGLMRILEEAGLLRALARLLRPMMTRLFPDVPPEHPAMAAMILNLAANMLGLNNAATPFGLRAMVHLDELNKRKGVATDAMCLFLAINTSGLAVFPSSVIAARAAIGAKNLTGIVLPSILSTFSAAITALVMTKLLQRTRWFASDRYPADAPQRGIEPGAADRGGPSDPKAIEVAEAVAAIDPPKVSPLRLAVILVLIGSVAAGFVRTAILPETGAPAGIFPLIKELSEGWLLPLLILVIVLYGFGRRVKVYETLVKGAKEAFNIAVMIIPFMVALLVAVGMFRASGAMDILVRLLAPITSLFGFPAEALPMALIRPLSGSGSLAVLTETMKTYGPDSFIGFLVSVISGSFETTFYVLAVYFGAVGVRATRHTVLACLAADLTGVTMATVFSRIFY